MILNPDLAFMVCWTSKTSVVGELGSLGAMFSWFLLVMFLCLPFAIWLSIVLAGVAVSDGGLSVMQASVSVLLGDKSSLCTQECRYSCETHSHVVVLGYVALWPQSVLGAGRKKKTPVPGCS